jgi:peptide chain release factor 1
MIDRLEQMEQRYNDLQSQFSLPEVINDHEKYQKTPSRCARLKLR